MWVESVRAYFACDIESAPVARSKRRDHFPSLARDALFGSPRVDAMKSSIRRARRRVFEHNWRLDRDYQMLGNWQRGLESRVWLDPGIRVEHFLVFTITSRMVRILMEHIRIKNSLESKLQTFFIYSVRIRNTLKVIAKTVKCLTLPGIDCTTLPSNVMRSSCVGPCSSTDHSWP